ncbi:MAG: sigma-70 family RNA polymerase sigma factor [Lachnospiraceae bacterium]|nr:sigma-70 family RNA polymerase sigma factor [Lachnospiraceae bacterium]
METVSLQEKIYRDYHNKVYAYALSHVRSREDAEDIVSEVFLKVYEKLDTYDESKASMSTWIYQMTKNKVIDYYRRYHVSEELPEEIESSDEIDSGLLNEETLSELAEALKQLPQELRDIVVLRYYKGYTLQKTAEMMSLSYGVVKLRHKEALQRLQASLKR